MKIYFKIVVVILNVTTISVCANEGDRRFWNADGARSAGFISDVIPTQIPTRNTEILPTGPPRFLKKALEILTQEAKCRAIDETLDTCPKHKSCQPTCLHPKGRDECPEQECKPGCVCKEGMVRRESDKKCVTLDQCPPLQGSRRKISRRSPYLYPGVVPGRICQQPFCNGGNNVVPLSGRSNTWKDKQKGDLRGNGDTGRSPVVRLKPDPYFQIAKKHADYQTRTRERSQQQKGDQRGTCYHGNTRNGNTGRSPVVRLKPDPYLQIAKKHADYQTRTRERNQQ